MLDIGTIQRQQYIPFGLSGGVAFESPGSYTFIVPPNIYLMSGVFIAPGSIFGKGGDLRWINNFPVSPGETLTVEIGSSDASGGNDLNTQVRKSTDVIVRSLGRYFSDNLSSTLGAGPFGGIIGGGNGGASSGAGFGYPDRLPGGGGAGG